MNNIIETHFHCAITMTYPVTPMSCPCGHLFEATAIAQWLNNNNTCPVSRLPLTYGDLRFNAIVHNFLEEYLRRHSDETNNIETQTDIHMSQIVQDEQTLKKPFVAFLDSTKGENFDNLILNAEQLTYKGDDMIIDLGDQLFNRSSKNIRLEAVVDRMNRNFINHFVDRVCDHPIIVIRKFCYQHRSDSVVEVARILMHAGYYVFDLFEINKHNDLHSYVLYSADVKLDGSLNRLSRFIKFSNRL